MGCCGKTKRRIRSGVKKTKQIAEGFANLARGKRFEFTNERISTCRKCEFNYWIKQSLWCSICKCFIPAKARVEENTCPKNYWRR